jgi:hypothetical protein
MSIENNDIQTVQWIETTQMHGAEHTPPSRSSYWLRVNPPALAWKNYIDDSWDHNVQDARGILHTASTWDTTDLDSKHPISIEYEIAEVRAPVGTQSESWSTESVIQDGRELLRHSCEEIQHNFRIVHTLLSELDTGHLVRNETRQFDLRSGLEVMAEVRSEFVYNAPIPGDIFEMLPNRPVKESDLDALFPNLWPALGESDKQTILQTIENSDAAWMHSDFRKFAREWSFEFQPNVPTRRDWSDLIKKHAGQWRGWKSAVIDMKKWQGVTVQSANRVFILMRPTDPKLADRSTLRIRANYQVEWADNGEVWESEADFYLMRIGRKYRILHWEFPLEEMMATHKVN